MLAAFLTTILFSMSGVTAMRSTRYLPSLEANFWRLCVATVLLAGFAHTWGSGLQGPALGWFLVSGLVGFGVGDIALYLAYPKLGSRLVVLVVHCVAAPLAAAVEWGWLGVPMAPREMLASLLILGGVATALYPGKASSVLQRGAGFRLGIAAALVAATGQALGAVLSRHAIELNLREGLCIDGLTAAYQRILAGIVLGGLTYAWSLWRDREGERPPPPTRLPGGLRKAAPWIAFNALMGPALGVGCFQWALSQRGTGVVLPIVALTPLVIVPFSMRMEGERPTPRSLIGGVVAVTGAVIHAVSHYGGR